MEAITDINIIRQALKGCEEVTLPYKFTKGLRIKYITVKGEDESFYDGGVFDGMGNHVIFIQKGSTRTSVPTCIRNDDGEVVYRSRFFIDPNNTTCEEKQTELEKTVLAQQKVIEKIAEQLKLLEESKANLQAEQCDLVNLYQDKVDEVNGLKEKEKKYRLLLSQYA
jgi:hypothetical protein